ncbi:MAG: sugar phosphate isomerase/epimerase [Chitinophagia bacterium]|nr:sugar phosphate isomerase/epimerase [Chitinophagia bacterium]
MISRREYLRQLAILAAGSTLAPKAFASAKDRKIGVQLYTIRGEIAKDAMGSIRKVAQLGFQEVENFGYNGKFFGMDAKAYRNLLSETGLSAPSGHYLLNNLRNGWDKAVEDAAAIGQQYMVLAFLMPNERKTADDYKKVAELLNQAGETCRKAGIQLAYHNHDFEFQPIGDTLPFDILMGQTEPSLVQAELDLYWAVKANQQPLDIFRKYPKRISLWHVKDMDNTEKKNFTEVGSGTIDFTSIFKAHHLSGMKHFFVEQDVCPGSPFDSIAKSIAHIQGNLLKYV